MPELSVVIVATDNEQRAVLQVLVDGTSVARTVHTCASFPVAASDPITRRVRSANPDVTLVDIPGENPALALRAIELLHQEMPEAAIFAIGSLSQPQTIVNAMRAGAREFIERPTTTTDLLEAFVRLTTAQRRSAPGRNPRARFLPWSTPKVETARLRLRSISRWRCSPLTADCAGGHCAAWPRRAAHESQAGLQRGRRDAQSAPHGRFPAGKLHDAAQRRTAVAGGNQRSGSRSILQRRSLSGSSTCW